jgi:hypothetical protein
MLKKFTFFLIFLVLGFSVFSQENIEGTKSTNPGRFSFGFNYMFGPKLDMAVGAEFGFLIFRNNTWDIRNSIVFNNYQITDADGIVNYTQNLSDKIIIGGGNNYGPVHPYSFLEGGIGFYSDDSDDSKKFWSTPLAYFAGLGIGFEVFAKENWSFSLDTGVAWHFFDEKIFLFQKFTMGMKLYF